MVNKWIWVTTGGVSSFLLGGTGAMYAPKVADYFKPKNDDDSPADAAGEDEGAVEEDGRLDSELQVAYVSDDMSFGEAFAAAREEVGPGGVFYWHRGIYNTFYKDEWEAMTAEEKYEFGESANNMFPAPENPEDAIRPILADDVTEETPVAGLDIVDDGKGEPKPDMEQMAAKNTTEDDEPGAEQEPEMEPTVVGRTTIDGHRAIKIDIDGDNTADYIVVDADDSKDISEDDLIIDRDGNMATLGGEYVGNLMKDGDNMAGNAADGDGSYGVEPEVVGNGTIDGHQAYKVDTNGDGKADYVVVDADDSKNLSQDDQVIDKDGNLFNMRGEYLGAMQEDGKEMTSNDLNQDDGDEDEVAIVGYGEYDGHKVVGLDSTGDNETDFVIIDVDDDSALSPDDVVVTDDGQSVTLGELEAGETNLDNVDNDDIPNDMDGIVSL